MTPPILVRRQLALEGVGFDARGRLVARAGTTGVDVPRFYVARHAGGVDRYFGAELFDSLVGRLASLPAEVCFGEVIQAMNLLREDALCRDVWVGTSYTFPSAPPPADFPDIAILTAADRDVIARFDRDLLAFARPIFAIVVGGEIASTCVSAREDEFCAEAWVQTAPTFRRRGFGGQVTAAWGSSIVGSGRIAFYSHAKTNLASRGIALSLGLSWFLDAAGYL